MLYLSPYVEEQAIDRVHRIGQVKEVHVIKMTMEDSIEERIEELKESKLYIISSFLFFFFLLGH
jgi:SWI/SNF-related matrix-associated actin-dependent regulator of chromatin subfamily A3